MLLICLKRISISSAKEHNYISSLFENTLGLPYLPQCFAGMRQLIVARGTSNFSAAFVSGIPSLLIAFFLATYFYKQKLFCCKGEPCRSLYGIPEGFFFNSSLFLQLRFLFFVLGSITSPLSSISESSQIIS